MNLTFLVYTAILSCSLQFSMHEMEGPVIDKHRHETYTPPVMNLNFFFHIAILSVPYNTVCVKWRGLTWTSIVLK